MGYPEDYEIVVSDTQAYRQFGNSVVVPVVEKIAEAVMETLKKPAGQKLDLVLREEVCADVSDIPPRLYTDITYKAKKSKIAKK